MVSAPVLAGLNCARMPLPTTKMKNSAVKIVAGKIQNSDKPNPGSEPLNSIIEPRKNDTMPPAVRTPCVVANTSGPEGNPSTNGALVAYDAQRGGKSGIFWRPVSGGAEVELEMAGHQGNPSVAGNVIAFESRATAIDAADIFAYDISTNRLFQITNTPLVNEQLNDITVLPDGSIRIVWASDEAGPDQRHIKSATFQLPPAVSTLALHAPASVTVNATSPSGAIATYVVTATDAVDPNPTVACAPPSGSLFRIGTMPVARYCAV